MAFHGRGSAARNKQADRFELFPREVRGESDLPPARSFRGSRHRADVFLPRVPLKRPRGDAA